MKKTLGMLAALAVLVVTSTSAWAIGTGTVEPSGGAWYPAGTNLTVTATAGTNDMLKGWTGDTNSATFGVSTISFVVDAPRTIQAVFADIMHTITASVVGNGTISPLGDTDFAEGDDALFTITPAANHHITNVVVDTVSIGVTNSYTFNNVTAVHTIVAQFAIDTYTVNFLQGLYGTLSDQPTTQTIDHGADATPPTITADAGYTAAGWDGSYTGITSDLTLTALYTTNIYTLTFDSAGGSAVADITQPYTTTVNSPEDPTRTGYTFAGWNPSLPATMPLNGGAHTAQWTANDFSVIVISEHGTPDPAAGTNWYEYGTEVNFAMTDSPVELGGTTQYVATGWVSTGSLDSGTGTNGTFTITNDTSMTWQWSTNYWIELDTAGE